ncbi:transcription activator BRG1-like [Ptychodera flava]|uniref:transcription activator BRG1-like n=1 Tax=Ptychodera flava TaxID=63121 RepID=UPI003969BC4F
MAEDPMRVPPPGPMQGPPQMPHPGMQVPQPGMQGPPGGMPPQMVPPGPPGPPQMPPGPPSAGHMPSGPGPVPSPGPPGHGPYGPDNIQMLQKALSTMEEKGLQNDPRYSQLMAMANRAKQVHHPSMGPGQGPMEPSVQDHPPAYGGQMGGNRPMPSDPQQGHHPGGPQQQPPQHQGIPGQSKPSPFNPIQIHQLKAQIMAYKLMARSQPIPENLRLAAQGRHPQMSQQQQQQHQQQQQQQQPLQQQYPRTSGMGNAPPMGSSQAPPSSYPSSGQPTQGQWLQQKSKQNSFRQTDHLVYRTPKCTIHHTQQQQQQQPAMVPPSSQAGPQQANQHESPNSPGHKSP